MPDGAALLRCLGSCWAPHLVPSALLGIVSSRCRAEGKLTCMGFITSIAPCFFVSFLNRSCHLIQNRQLDVELASQSYLITCHQAFTEVMLRCNNQKGAEGKAHSVMLA